MSQGTLDRSTFEAIEAYVLDRMSADERTAFEQRMIGDASLKAEVDLERENIRAVELGGVTRMLREIAAAERRSEETGSRWSRYVKYAAVIALLLTGTIWWSMRPSTSERLFAEHYAADPGLPVTMGVTDDPAFADAMVSYKEGNYADAYTKWSGLLQRDAMNDTLAFYVANASLADGNAAAAIPVFLGVVNDTASTFHDKARWFLFLAYLKVGDVQKAKAIPFEGDDTYAERARAIATQLE